MFGCLNVFDYLSTRFINEIYSKKNWVLVAVEVVPCVFVRCSSNRAVSRSAAAGDAPQPPFIFYFATVCSSR